ncbi:MAG: polyprenol monophosphomannose synthase [Myxococcales bacterium]|nr:polyprenol monophosphomannose synthase [Polyangiaceae bacterium]MDW8249024.1 polyprenol monophosphomannose synthase [Myxococcales bacterium]
MPAPLLVLIPTYNEVDNLQPLLTRLFLVIPWAHALVVDDNSPDGTGALAEQLASRDSRVHVLHRHGPRGLGRAYVDGFRWGLARDFSFFFEMDADLSHDPVHLPAMLAALDQGADMVVGSRNIPGGQVRGWGLGRHLLSQGGSLYARSILGLPLRDLTTGYKGYTRRALQALEIDTLRSDGYAFQIETTYRAVRRSLVVAEVPIVFVDRRVGRSKMSHSILFEAIVFVWKLKISR